MSNVIKLKLLSLAAVITLSASGCGQGTSVSGKLRHELFVECMELSAKIGRQGDDDVADIVEECSTQAYYIALGIARAQAESESN